MFGRPEDPRYQAGAARVENFLCLLTGPLARRPGFSFLRRIKPGATRARLIPFVFSRSQAMRLEIGWNTVSSREIGYIRFHTENGAVLHQKPADYRAPSNVTAIATATDTISVGSTANYVTGDPVALTMTPGPTAVTFDVANQRVNLASASTTLLYRTPVVFTNSGGALPPEIVANRIYYAGTVAATYFTLVDANLAAVTFSTAGSGTHNIATMPACNSPFGPVDVRYIIVVSGTDFKLAETRAKALGGVAIDITYGGVGNRRLHYAYEKGSLAYDSGGGYTNYCMRAPWRGRDLAFCYPSDNTDHATTDTAYWCRLPATYSAVTASTVTSRITWATHGLLENDPVIFGGTAVPTPLVAGTAYYVASPDTNTFRVSVTPGGAPITLTSAGTSVDAYANSYYEVPHFIDEDELFEVTYAQSNDIITLANATRPVAELRRYADDNWQLVDVEFSAQVPAPSSLICQTLNRGAGMVVTVFNTATPSRLDTLTNHNFAKGETVYLAGLSAQGLLDDFYQIHDNTITGTSNLYLRSITSGASMTASGTGGTGTLHASDMSINTVSEYMVTAVDTAGIESPGSAVLSVDNNLYNEGASNELLWSVVSGAARYRVYKKVLGVFGFIGDSETNTFVDDGIAPDTSISPPIPDPSLFRARLVTFDSATNEVVLADNQLTEGSPVVFESSGTLPTYITHQKTYYAINVTPDTFQITATFGGTAVLPMTGSPTGECYALTGAFPAAVGYYEQRRCFAGSLTLPQDIWMTAAGSESDMTYSIPTTDADRVYARIAVRESTRIRHILPLAQMLLLTDSSELRVTPLNSDAITPDSISVRPQTFIGSSHPQPVLSGNTVVYAAERGGHLYQMGYTVESGGYQSGDLCLLAQHLFENGKIAQLAQQRAPFSIIWVVTEAGELFGLTYLPDENIAAWHKHTTTGGLFESACVVPSAAQGEDLLCVIVNRGGTRYLEQMTVQRSVALEDSFYVDSGLTYSGAATTTLTGLAHLEGQTVAVLADGVASTAVVASGGITLSKAASKVTVGLPMTATLETLPVAMQQADAFGAGKQKNVTNVWARVNRSCGFSAGPLGGTMRAVNLSALTTDLVPLAVSGAWTADGQVSIQQASPLPLTIVGLVVELAMGD